MEMGLLTWVLIIPAIAALLVAGYSAAALSIAYLCGFVSTCLLALLLYQRSTLFGWDLGWRSPTKVAGSTRINVQFRQVNSSLYELHRPKGTLSMQVLFFHGLQSIDVADAHVWTWKSEDGSVIWPRDWLAEVFPGAQIFTMSYNEGVKNLDMHLVGENLTSDVMDGEIGQVPHCPVIFVGYCIGGLVIKQICLQAKSKFHSGKTSPSERKKLGMFLDNIRGVFYYSTPHRGSSLVSNIADGPMFRYFKVLDREAARLNSEFDGLRASYPKWKVSGLGESLPTKLGLFHGHVVVPEGASREGDDFHVVEADHNSICQPQNKKDRRFYALKNLIISIVIEMGEEAKVRDATCLQESRPQNFQPLPKELVDMDDRVQTIESKLCNVRKLGLAGMGGLGKSTLAKALFNQLGSKFEYTSFVPNMKLIAGTEDDAEGVVWEHMHHHGKKVEGEKNWSRLKGKKTLLVLDDISLRDEEVLYNLAHDSMPESRFIVTSRDQDLLSSLDEVFVVPFLKSKDAEALFRKFAFPNQVEPPKELEFVVKSVIERCDGLPLTLEVLGKYLKRKRDYIEWEQTLNALAKAEEISSLNERLWEKLRPSYNDLTKKEQQIFLDATTFFCNSERHSLVPRSEGWTLREAKAAWRAAYDASETLLWQTLVDRSLVYYVREEDTIKVHEQLQSLGQKIASEPKNKGKCRIWEGQVALKTLQTTKTFDGKGIHALQVGYPGDFEAEESLQVPKTTLSKLKKVQFLEANVRITIDEAKDGASVPTEVVLLKCVGEDLFNPALQTRLAVLKLYWMGDLPPSIGQLLGLQHLKIELFYARTLPDCFGELRALQHLTFSEADLLESLPESFGQLSALKYLKFSQCGRLCTLPKSFGQLKALRRLEFHVCDTLKRLPASFGELNALSHLKFRNCDDLHTLPESFGQLKALSELEMTACPGLESLPKSFGELKALKRVILEHSPMLRMFPESFGQLSTLTELVVNENLSYLPDTFGQLTKLERLKIFAMTERWPESMGNLQGLRDLTVGCYSATTIPDWIKSLPSLHRLHLVFGRSVQEIPPSLPPWLVMPKMPNGILRWSFIVFQVQDGCFSLIENESHFLKNHNVLG